MSGDWRDRDYWRPCDLAAELEQLADRSTPDDAYKLRAAAGLLKYAVHGVRARKPEGGTT